MCIIVHKTEWIGEKDVKEAGFQWDGNPDGAGIMWREGPNAKWHGPLRAMLKKDFINELENIPDGAEVIYHCRIATHGSVNLKNTHPYGVHASRLGSREAARGTNRRWLFHNGIVRGTEADKPGAKHSDTYYVARQLDAKGYEQAAKILEKHAAGNRFAFVDATGVHRFGKWVEIERGYASHAPDTEATLFRIPANWGYYGGWHEYNYGYSSRRSDVPRLLTAAERYANGFLWCEWCGTLEAEYEYLGYYVCNDCAEAGGGFYQDDDDKGSSGIDFVDECIQCDIMPLLGTSGDNAPTFFARDLYPHEGHEKCLCGNWAQLAIYNSENTAYICRQCHDENSHDEIARKFLGGGEETPGASAIERDDGEACFICGETARWLVSDIQEIALCDNCKKEWLEE